MDQHLPLFDGIKPEEARPDLEQIRTLIGDCQRCKLSRHRQTIVFGYGNPKASLMFVGEAPGQSEDEQGVPFVGRAGELLFGVLWDEFEVDREDVYITNIVKCRPPKNRDPELDEITSCRGFLDMQIKAVTPKVLVGLGKFAGQYLTQKSLPITQLRGKFYQYPTAMVWIMPTIHPAYVLRNPIARQDLVDDLRMAINKSKER